MRRIRVIPVLLIDNKKLVKTIRFKNAGYVGDPINALKIFNEKEVDEVVVLDISATRERRPPNVKYIKDLASECFMPMSYGGGIRSVDHASAVFQTGIEKIVLSAAACENPKLVTQLSNTFGAQSVSICMDIQYDLFNVPRVYTLGGTKKIKGSALEIAKNLQESGAGEIILQSIGRDGTGKGYDLPLIKKLSAQLQIPVVALGGASTIQDFREAIRHGASAVAGGSMFVYHGPHKAVLINYPSQEELTNHLYSAI
jgi:imidazole glycerol-phosphate synthase subunit HisF